MEMFEYDLYIPLGPACRPAYHLQKCGLRRQAFPLDWQITYSLDTIIHLFETGFRDFFESIEVDFSRNGADNNRMVRDVKNNILSIHHFSKDLSITDARDLFHSKMQIRYQSLEREIKRSKKIALIMNWESSKEELENLLLNFSEIYPQIEIMLINMRNDKSLMENQVYEESLIINDKLKLKEYVFNDVVKNENAEKEDWRGNIQKWEMILEKYKDSHVAKKLKEFEKKSIVIYGAGKIASCVLKQCIKYGINVIGFAVTDRIKNPDKINGIKVSMIEDYESSAYVIIAVKDEESQEEIKKNCFLHGYMNCISYDLLFGIL